MLSIIIPVYNEEGIIKRVLDSFTYSDKIEVIVVDGGSSDQTVALARKYPVKVIQSVKNRAVQMNEGAKAACGNIFLFLHADCLLEEEGLKAIKMCLNDGYVGGCLSQRIISDRLIYPVRNTIYAKLYSKISNGVYRLIENSGNMRARLMKVFYGDQAIFVKRNIFFNIGGFDNVELFDDIIFSKKLRKEGRTTILNKKVYVSARRWERQGVIKTTLIYWLLTIGLLIGISCHNLRRIYRDVR